MQLIHVFSKKRKKKRVMYNYFYIKSTQVKNTCSVLSVNLENLCAFLNNFRGRKMYEMQ